MSAKILETTFRGRDTLRTTTANAVPMKELTNGFEFNYVGHVIQEIINEETGETFNSILVRDDSGEVYATRSEIFTNQLKVIIECVNELGDTEEEPLRIRVVKSLSKSNNEFITCALA